MAESYPRSPIASTANSGLPAIIPVKPLLNAPRPGASHVVIVPRKADLDAIRYGIPAATVVTIDDMKAATDNELLDRIDCFDVLAVLPGDASDKTRRALAEVLDRCCPYASTLRAVEWLSWVGRQSFEFPGLDSDGSRLAWVLSLPDWDWSPFSSALAADAGPDATEEELGLVSLDTVVAREVEWLWPDRVPLGKLTLIAGEKGAGKSFLTLEMASIVSRGAVWPDRPTEPVEAGHVVLVGAEDDLEDTIKPRLMAMGANCQRIEAVGIGRDRKGRAVHFTVADLWHLEGIMKLRPDTRLIVIDPITSYLGPINDHRNTELRAVLMPLAEFAKKHRVAVVLITHFNKGGTANKVMSRIIGSTAYTAVVRSVFAVAVDPENENRRLLMPLVSNLKFERKSLAYSIVDDAVKWEDEAVKLDPNEVVSGQTDGKAERRKRAVEWLQALLAGGALPSEEVVQRGQAAGFGINLIWEVKRQANIRARKAGKDKWLWVYDPPSPSPEPPTDGIWTKTVPY